MNLGRRILFWAPEFLPFVVVPLILALFFFLGSRIWAPFACVGGVCLLLFIFNLWFFRDPLPHVTDVDEHIVSPATGKVVEIKEHITHPWVGDSTRISIFLSVFDVHVNRHPINGTVEEINYHPGKFLMAFNEKASDDNERNTVYLRHDSGYPVAMVQIAGFIARRIICDVFPGVIARKGHRMGMIRYGSRVDLFVPSSFEVNAHLGQRVHSGQTVLVHAVKGAVS